MLCQIGLVIYSFDFKGFFVMARILVETLRRELPTEKQGKLEKMGPSTCRIYISI